MAASPSDGSVPRFGLALKSFLKSAFVKLGYEKPTAEQELAILQFVAGRDMFVSLPTGEGKSLNMQPYRYCQERIMERR